MNEAIRAASNPNTTIASVLNALPQQQPQQLSLDNNGQPNAPIPQPIAISTPSILTSNADSQLFFSALLANQPPIASSRGILGLLVLPTGELTKHISHLDLVLQASGTQCCYGVVNDGMMGLSSPINTNATTTNGSSAAPPMTVAIESAGMYLRAVAKHVGIILEAWNKGTLSNKNVESIAKATSVAAYLCSTSTPSLISTSGILSALAQLASGYKDTQQSRIDSNNNEYKYQTLTPIHAEFLQCCILGKHYRLADMFVGDNKVHSVAYPLPKEIVNQSKMDDKKKGRFGMDGQSGASLISQKLGRGGSQKGKKHTKSLVSVESYLRYYYNLGVVNMANDKYLEAIGAFKVCMTIPSSITSAITIAARKKMLLASCLLLEWNEEEDMLLKAGSKNKLNTFSSAEVSKKVGEKKPSQAEIITQQLLTIPNGTSHAVIKYVTEASSTSRKLKRKALDSAESLTAGGMMDTEDSPDMEPNSGMDDVNRTTVCHASATGYGNELSERVYKKNFFGLFVYDELISHFVKCDLNAYSTLVSFNENLLSFDGNTDLVDRLKEVMHHRSVRNISRIYSAIPISKFVDLLELRSTSDTLSKEDEVTLVESILSTIAFRQVSYQASSSITHVPIVYSIDVEKGIIYFDDEDGSNESAGDNRLDIARTQEELSRRIIDCMNLSKRVTDLDVAAATSEKYVVHVVNKEKVDGKSGSKEAGTGTVTGQSVADMIGGDEMMDPIL